MTKATRTRFWSAVMTPLYSRQLWHLDDFRDHRRREPQSIRAIAGAHVMVSELLGVAQNSSYVSVAQNSHATPFSVNIPKMKRRRVRSMKAITAIRMRIS